MWMDVSILLFGNSLDLAHWTYSLLFLFLREFSNKETTVDKCKECHVSEKDKQVWLSWHSPDKKLLITFWTRKVGTFQAKGHLASCEAKLLKAGENWGLSIVMGQELEYLYSTFISSEYKKSSKTWSCKHSWALVIYWYSGSGTVLILPTLIFYIKPCTKDHFPVKNICLTMYIIPSLKHMDYM